MHSNEKSDSRHEIILAHISTQLHAELEFQNQLLPKVSRSFALTIPQLPEFLCLAVTNAYLLCRIADAIEDDPAISAQRTREIYTHLIAALDGEAPAHHFCALAGTALSDETDPAERQLVAEADKVISVFLAFPDTTRKIIATCLKKMCAGMPEYQPGAHRGLDSLSDLDAYCYFVAGVVGEMLTGLFCDYAEDIAAQKDKLEKLSTSFGQGLQMTNIIKDVWDDLERGFCWLPRDIYTGSGYNLDQLSPNYNKNLFRSCQSQLISIAHGHLQNALDYSLCIPERHKGIRIFCLWAVGLALPTLQKVLRSEAYYNGKTVKMSRARMLLVTQLIASSARSNTAQRVIFKMLGLGLPFVPISGAEHTRAMNKIQPSIH
ncbi:farnesyl-diphosphate farnesyltransferase [Alteromonadaceae bacterium 2753L.S.0a.02]|nr:farnesyl-diphosphate farnesyltransferase [Alteromonadaceae bacterium 2753L.S.0a.02]